jgi:hypothetical protein
MRPAAKSPEPLAPRISSEESLYRSFRSRIEEGIYKAGQPLPKTGYCAASERVGTRTDSRQEQPVFPYDPADAVGEVVQHLRRLPAAEGLVRLLDKLNTPGTRVGDLPPGYRDLVLLTSRVGMHAMIDYIVRPNQAGAPTARKIVEVDGILAERATTGPARTPDGDL